MIAPLDKSLSSALFCSSLSPPAVVVSPPLGMEVVVVWGSVVVMVVLLDTLVVLDTCDVVVVDKVVPVSSFPDGCAPKGSIL